MQIDHLALACLDVEKLCAWYEAALGFHRVCRKEPSRPGGQPAFLVSPGPGSAVLELFADDGQTPPERRPTTRGIAHIALGVEDIAAWETRATAHGARWLGERGEALGGGLVRSFLDPEGNMLQFVERPRPPAARGQQAGGGA